MTPELTDEFRDLLEHFADLPSDDRARILSLVKSLSICHAALAASKGGLSFSRGILRARMRGSTSA